MKKIYLCISNIHFTEYVAAYVGVIRNLFKDEVIEIDYYNHHTGVFDPNDLEEANYIIAMTPEPIVGLGVVKNLNDYKDKAFVLYTPQPYYKVLDLNSLFVLTPVVNCVVEPNDKSYLKRIMILTEKKNVYVYINDSASPSIARAKELLTKKNISKPAINPLWWLLNTKI